MSFDIDYNIPTIIAKRNVDSMENPIGVKLLEKRQVMDNHSCVVLSQIPDENYRITIEGFNEVFNSDELGNNNFYVNYSQGVIYFLPRYNGKTVVVEYYGIGYELISASRVFYKYDKHGGIIETLEEILDNAKEQLELIKTLGDSVKVIEKLEMDLENGKVLHDNLENDIEVGTPLQENLHSDIVEAKKWKDQLHQDVTDGKVLQPLLQQTVDDAEDVKVRLDKSIANAQDDIATIEATGNKEILIQSSQWVLNGDMYEKEITHDLYSENLHVTVKNSNTKEALTIGYKILDKSRILLKSDENINMSVILSASYYHATQTISDDIAEEVFKARGGQPQLKDRLDNFDEHLETIETKVETLEKETVIGCVLRPTADISNPWILFQDDAHESGGITRIEHNSDGTIQLYYDKNYKKIKSFNVFADEMMKIYGLEVGASVGLNTAKLFLISNLVFGFTINFSLTDGISCSNGFVESCEWIQGVGAKVKFKNVPKQLPNTAQVSTTNSLNLNTTCSITGNREITMKFYKQDGSLITDITGNWNTMVDVNYRGLVNFNALSVYDENILSSMALMFTANMKQ